jgi:hypothetical protein
LRPVGRNRNHGEKIAKALKQRAIELEAEEAPNDNLFNAIFDVARQAHVMQYKLVSLLGE